MTSPFTAWRKSSRSADTNCVELAWRKSSYSDHTECVELAPSAVRDSKNLPGPILRLESPGVTALVAAARAGALDLPG
jgi:hypothetical protein